MRQHKIVVHEQKPANMLIRKDEILLMMNSRTRLELVTVAFLLSFAFSSLDTDLGKLILKLFCKFCKCYQIYFESCEKHFGMRLQLQMYVASQNSFPMYY